MITYLALQTYFGPVIAQDTFDSHLSQLLQGWMGDQYGQSFLMQAFLLFQIGKATGKLRTFIIEPFIPHKDVSFLVENKSIKIKYYDRVGQRTDDGK